MMYEYIYITYQVYTINLNYLEEQDINHRVEVWFMNIDHMVYFFPVWYNKAMVIIALILRILSNPLANVFQKKLTSDYSSFWVNAVTYGGLSLLTLPQMFNIDFFSFHSSIWLYGVIGGLFGAMGNACLVKALSLGDLSLLGPINSYKSVVAMIVGIFLLDEIPSLEGVLAVGLVIWGSYFVFDTTKERFTLALLKRKDILYRFAALVFTALEAVMIKQVILLSNITVSFIFWCVFGFLFSLIFVSIRKEKIMMPDKNALLKFSGLIAMFGVMQYTTNYVFKNMNVSYALALFQLSSVVSVVFGYKFFKETQILKKLIGTLIMVIGATIIICF